MRALALSRLVLDWSMMATSCPANAKFCAMPWPISPAPITAMRAFAMSARRVAAIGVKDMAGIEIRRLRRQKQQGTCEIFRLAQAAFRHARQEALAHGLRFLGVLIHPGGERRAENGGPERIDGDAGLAPVAAQSLGDAVDRRLGGAIGGVAGRMAEQAARRRGQDHLAAAALLEHLSACGARHQP